MNHYSAGSSTAKKGVGENHRTVIVSMSVACALSFLTFLGVILTVPTIYSEIGEIWRELDDGMMEFKLLSNDLWREMMTIPAKNGKNRLQKRQSYGRESAYSEPATTAGYDNPPLPAPQVNPSISVVPEPSCNCNPNNNCPAGPDGVPGDDGVNGEDGFDGPQGEDGPDADSVYQPADDLKRPCYVCPTGPMGLPGPQGYKGEPGLKGPKGITGMGGRNTPPGSPGEMGVTGNAGKNGLNGAPGEGGRNGRKPVGVPGPKGYDGEEGGRGGPGPDGRPGNDGNYGPEGEPGPVGEQGGRGSDGTLGVAGGRGRPGRDAEYCSCPDQEGNRRSAAGKTKGSSASNYASLPWEDDKDEDKKKPKRNSRSRENAYSGYRFYSQKSRR